MVTCRPSSATSSIPQRRTLTQAWSSGSGEKLPLKRPHPLSVSSVDQRLSVIILMSSRARAAKPSFAEMPWKELIGWVLGSIVSPLNLLSFEVRTLSDVYVFVECASLGFFTPSHFLFLTPFFLIFSVWWKAIKTRVFILILWEEAIIEAAFLPALIKSLTFSGFHILKL